MKALTLHQPWASLVALGVKSIETRSWSTKYRGPLAIHAGRSTEEMVGVAAGRLCREDDAAICSALVDHGIQQMADLPLGAVVATCTLADVVPINPESYTADDNLVRTFPDFPSHVAIFHHNDRYGRRCKETRLEAVYGDYSPGRFAWLLDDIEPCEPIPARGRQGLWTWAPTPLEQTA